MLKMKVDPAMYMKTKHDDKLSRVNKAKRRRFRHDRAMLEALQRSLRDERVLSAWFIPFFVIGPAGRAQKGSPPTLATLASWFEKL